MEIAETKKLGHVMVDLETMGNESDAVIVSIGAVEFDIATGETGREFFQRVDISSCIVKGMTINGDTVYWWMRQSEFARLAICEGEKKNITQVLYEFRKFIEELGTETVQFWGNGITFDGVILSNAYRACGQKEPWNFRRERDVRTLVSFAPEVKENYPKFGTEHNPIDDCKYQIGFCTAIWQKINNLTTLINIGK